MHRRTVTNRLRAGSHGPSWQVRAETAHRVRDTLGCPYGFGLCTAFLVASARGSGFEPLSNGCTWPQHGCKLPREPNLHCGAGKAPAYKLFTAISIRPERGQKQAQGEASIDALFPTAVQLASARLISARPVEQFMRWAAACRS
jgi:hypothetical protein